mmetsp:Transcript_16991/g.31452  ORF Transcript_16991/g.31452 Transcript_16991/m.31452 type:complete len:138 (+) Transcript_16991:847-1260(+)
MCRLMFLGRIMYRTPPFARIGNGLRARRHTWNYLRPHPCFVRTPNVQYVLRPTGDNPVGVRFRDFNFGFVVQPFRYHDERKTIKQAMSHAVLQQNICFFSFLSTKAKPSPTNEVGMDEEWNKKLENLNELRTSKADM